MFALSAWRHVMRLLMMFVRICGDGRADCSSQRAAQNGAIATSDFVTDGCTSRASEATAYGGIHC